MAYAEPEDVSKRHIGEPLDAQVLDVIGVRLDDAERLIKTQIKDLDDQVTAGTIDVEAVKQVESEMILRLIRNPEGYTSETDGNYSYMISASVASGVLEVLPREWRLLGVSRGAFVLSTTPRMPWETS